MTGRPSLTAQQAKLLAFVEAEIGETRTAPSFEQMKAHMELASKSGIHRPLSGLEERGYIQRMPNRARAIALLPEGEFRPQVAAKPTKQRSVAVPTDSDLIRALEARGYLVLRRAA